MVAPETAKTCMLRLRSPCCEHAYRDAIAEAGGQTVGGKCAQQHSNSRTANHMGTGHDVHVNQVLGVVGAT
eukprot:6338802-Amphidinium_carterae.1